MKRILLTLTLTALALTGQAADKRIVLIAGNPSHGPGEHEHRAGCLLFQTCLSQVPGVTTVVTSNGWPQDLSVFDGAAAVVIYCDGGRGHPFAKPERLQFLDGLMKKGVGLGTVHYACEVEKDLGGKEFLDWIGGYFETFWSVNPHWDGDFKSFPKHAVANGVRPFQIRDEWYYHMRFRENMQGVTPILSAVPPDSTRGKPGANDAHGGNPEVQKHKGEAEHVMWVAERPDGGRGFGFTGGHFHKNWANEDFRKVVLNGIRWIAKADVPEDGTKSSLTPEQLQANLDPKGKPKPKPVVPRSVQ